MMTFLMGVKWQFQEDGGGTRLDFLGNPLTLWVIARFCCLYPNYVESQLCISRGW